jgi:hypothetical protein
MIHDDYYRRYIRGFSKIVHPITSLQNKGIKFEWTQECEERFQLLKKLLTSASILKIVNPNFVVCTYSCIEGLNGVLIQTNHVVCYESQKLEEHEKNYATHDLKLIAIMDSLKMWREYLVGKRFELNIGHNDLKCLFE